MAMHSGMGDTPIADPPVMESTILGSLVTTLGDTAAIDLRSGRCLGTFWLRPRELSAAITPRNGCDADRQDEGDAYDDGQANDGWIQEAACR